MPRHRLTRVGTAMVISIVAGVARAAPPSATLAIDCAALGDEDRALLEARARAQLAYESARDGSAVIACLPSWTTITWLPAGGPRRERVVALDPDRAAAVDAILDALHVLLAAAGTRELPATQAPPSSAPNVARDVVAVAPPAEVPGLAALVGADTELWRGDVHAAVGLHAGARLALPRQWYASLLVAPNWGVGSSNGVGAWSLQGLARFDHVIVGHLNFGFGASARLLWASGTGVLAPSEQHATTGGGLLALAYDVSTGPVHLAVGPEFEALVRPIMVNVQGREVFRVPALLAALSVDLRVP